ncbi:AT-rich interactive domain-containing protein 4A-like isoform X2 [Dreissena polymorpha]|uniref:ARID domain-containing protein n=1 Tax=Dreissena polymorpha TaxID=45954 RepID=A0A9D4R885_DREPO|nr:AT-rich interactive domain-containing protein 4A-like isoform X2 [Dreissena polymorpha]KAH3856905.1 hypothetical protein DPMN_099500 [Dreissena polymorpha]
MASSEPPYLPIGTDVSAKYRGAFCEAKVKKIVKSVKCRVYLKETQSNLLVTDEFITGPLAIGANVEVKHPDTGRIMEAVIKQMSDSSMYTVVFDDADERTLRRTQLCLKGDKHFMESETLDNLPLSNPEHFGTPVITRTKRQRTSGGGASNVDESESSSEEDESPRKKYRGKNQELVGKPMFYEAGDRKKSAGVPVLVVLPDAHTTELKGKDHVLVRSFKDGKFLSAGRKELAPFTRDIVLKSEDKILKPAMEKALLYADNRELPLNWKREELLGSDDEDQGDDEESSEDEEQSEEKDLFVAQLYKFSDDRGTPINKGPCVGTKDLNLYRLFKVVKKLGGYNRVTNQLKWRLVYSKMQLPPSNTASTQIKNAYKKYLHAFEDFYRKLGNTMGTISRPSRSQADSGRSLLSFRGHDSSRNSDKNDSASEKAAEETPSEFDSDVDSVKTGTPKRPKSARFKVEQKDESATKKDDKDKNDVIKKVEDSPRKLQKKTDMKPVVTPEVEKRVPKRKEDGSMVTMSAGRGRKEKDTDDESKDKEKKIGRRRSTKTNDEVDVIEQEPKKQEEAKEKKKEESTENKSETDEKSSEKKIKKKKAKSDNGQSEEDSSMLTPTTSHNMEKLLVGARLRVLYGTGASTAQYEAKIMEVAPSGPKFYLVHYQGWNTRHDEWIGTDRIVKVIERPGSAKRLLGLKPSPKPETRGPSKKKQSLDRPPASPSSVKSDSSTSMSSIGGPGRPPGGKSARSPYTPPQSTGPSRPRPTRSNSIEMLVEGLPGARRRSRKTSSVYDSLNGSDSEESDKSDIEAEMEKKTEQDFMAPSDTPTKATSMPSITSESLDEPDVQELDSSLDLSPPKLAKVMDISKEKMEVDDDLEVVDEVDAKSLEEPIAPVLNVVEMDHGLDEQEKAIEENVDDKSVEEEKVIDVKEDEDLAKSEEKDVKEIKKEVKKKEPEKRGRKPVVKTEKEKIEADKIELREETVQDTLDEPKDVVPEMEVKEAISDEVMKTDESLYDFKDESEIEPEKRVARKKPTVQLDNEESKDVIKIMGREESPPKSLRTKDDACKDTKTNMIMMEEKDLSKSDSEVERRGRKRKVTKTFIAKDIKIMSKDAKSLTNVSVVISSSEKQLANSSPERKPFITLAEKKQGFSPMVRKVSSPPVICAIETSKSESSILNDGDKSTNNDEVKSVSDMVVIHKASPVKTDIILGRKIEDKSEDSNDGKPKEEDNTDKEQDGVHSVKKKVRKKTKKKLEMEEHETTVVVRKGGRGRPSARKSKDLSNSASPKEDTELSVKDSSNEIDLHCAEEIRSRSVSPVTLPGSSFIPESQGFVPRVETIDCRISDSQSSDSFSAKHDSGNKSQSSNKSKMFENTPPTTPEHDSDDTSQQNGQSDQQKSLKSAEDLGSRTDSSQATGHESPNGNASPSNRSTGSSSGVIAGSEGSLDMPAFMGSQKRRHDTDEHTPTKRRKRNSKGKANRSRHLAESDSEDMSKGRSPSYVPETYQRTPMSQASRSPRPQKYNFNLEEGQYLEGTARITFLVDKIQEIRKVYMNLKSEVACIDRRRKKLRRKEKESRSSSVVEVECS